MPIVASMGGVAATQTLTIVLRGLTLDQINTSNIKWLFRRELAVAILNGLVLSIFVGVTTFLWFNSLSIAILISLFNYKFNKFCACWSFSSASS